MSQPFASFDPEETDGHPADGLNDVPFAPPTVPVACHCLHCGQEYASAHLEVRNEGPDHDPAWCCPTPGCDGIGFLFDIWPTDPEWRDANGERVYCEIEEADEDLEFDGTVDDVLLSAYWREGHKHVLPLQDAVDPLVINFNGDAEHPLIRLFGECARPSLTMDDVPF